MMRLSMVVAMTVALSACGGGGSAPVLDGMYPIQTYTESKAAGGAGGTPATCNAEGPAVTGKTFLRLTTNKDFGELDWALCDSSDPATCSDQFRSFHDVSGKWEIGAATSAAFSGGLCTLFHAEGTVARASGGVRLEIKEWDEFPSGAESACTLSAADKLSGKPDCNDHIVVVGGVPTP